MSKLPPPFTEARFKEIEEATPEQIRKRVAPFINDLHSFLNRGSCLRNIQRTRRERNPNARSRSAFDGFAVEWEHWYTYNTGGRSEAQFNIGLFPEYLRIGLGFEFTAGQYGRPEAVQLEYRCFRSIVARHQRGFANFARENQLRVEWKPEGQTELRHISTAEETLKWLSRRPPKAPDWIFVGRLLDRREDAELLNDPHQLKNVIESVFGGFLHYWKETQAEANRAVL